MPTPSTVMPNAITHIAQLIVGRAQRRWGLRGEMLIDRRSRPLQK